MIHWSATLGVSYLLLAAQGDGGNGWSIPWPPLVLMGILFFVMFVMPDRKKAKEAKQLLESLKKNDRVLTAGGIYGTIVNLPANSKDVVIRVDENNNTRMRVLRSSVIRVVTDDDEEQEAT